MCVVPYFSLEVPGNDPLMNLDVRHQHVNALFQ